MASKRNAERVRLKGLYGSLYSRHHYDLMPRSFGCYYCGDISSDLDHCPPLSWVDSRTTADWIRDGISFYTVPACKSCNSALGNKPLFTLQERVHYVEQYLLRLYEKQSNLWSEEEIKEMGPDFRRMIAARKAQSTAIVQRARNAQWRFVRESL